MEKLSNIFSMFTDTGADLELDDVFIIIFVSLVILALLLGYLLGRKVTGKEKKKLKEAKKKAKQEKKEAKQKAKLEKTETNKASDDDILIEQPSKEDEEPKKSEKPKRAKKKNKEPESEQKPDWFDADDTDDVPSSMPIIPERKTTTFIETKAKETEGVAPVETDVATGEKPLSKSELKKRAKAEAAAKKLEEKEQKKAEKLSKKAAKKQPKDEGLESTVQVEPTEDSEPITAEEMAKRLENLIGTSSEAVSLGAAEEEEVPADKIGTIEATQIPGRHNDNWALEETKRQNEEADKKEAERKEKETLPFAFGSDIEASADDVQLSYKARKKLREEEEKKAQEEEQKKEKKHITSIFAKKQDQKEEVEEEEDFFDENYMGEEIPDSLAGFGFSAAPMLKNDEEKTDE